MSEQTRFSQLEVDGFEAPAELRKPPFEPVVQKIIQTVVAVQPAPVVMPRGNLIAVDLPSEVTGAVTYWTLSGDVEISNLTSAWKAEGLDETWLPQPTSPISALHRACKSLEEKHRLVRKHPEGGWVVVDEHAGDTLTYKVGTRFFLSCMEPLTVSVDGTATSDERIVEAMNGAFWTSLASLSTTDISGWLVHLIQDRLGGVALRDSGGIYFIPRESIGLLRAIKRVLGGLTHHVVQEIPAMRSGETIGAVLEAIRREAVDALTQIAAELNGEMGKRAVATRMQRLVDLTSKVNGYEKLLGIQLGDIAARAAVLRSQLEKASTRFNQLEVE